MMRAVIVIFFGFGIRFLVGMLGTIVVALVVLAIQYPILGLMDAAFSGLGVWYFVNRLRQEQASGKYLSDTPGRRPTWLSPAERRRRIWHYGDF